jgi:serine phosphatase RsbU (regulator of sigma subunit)
MPAALPRVLVADDQSDVVSALRLLLRAEGFDIDTASTVDELRARIAADRYDLLLMDLNYARDTTSGIEGLDLLTEIHACDSTLPVIVMTGWGSIDTAVEAMRRGARTFVHKPWDNATLAATIRREVCDGVAQRAADRHAARERIDAQRIQRALLPSPSLEFPGCAVAARWLPAETVGGDCYDTVPLEDGRVAITIADVAGKGLPAALVMAHLQASVRGYARGNATPAQVASDLNTSLCRNRGISRIVTFFAGFLDASTRELTYCNAGHNPPLVLRAGGRVERLHEGGLVLGALPRIDYRNGAVVLNAGDRLVLFTDGVTESHDAAGDEFGEERLAAAAAPLRPLPAEAIVERLFAEATTFNAGVFHDDATIVCVAV